MATVSTRLSNRATAELRWSSQVNQSVLLARYKKGLQIFQKQLLEYVSWMQNVNNIFASTVADTSEYDLPLWSAGVPDFYSIIQLRVAYKNDKHWNPVYRVCKPINLSDYNIRPTSNTYDNGELVSQGGRQSWEPYVWNRISMRNPRYTFVSKGKIKIYPTPVEWITNWIALTYNFIEDINGIAANTDESTLNLPRYFLDVIDDYLSFRLYQAENPELAQTYYQQFITTLHDNIYGLNKDKRAIEEDFANTSCFSHY